MISKTRTYPRPVEQRSRRGELLDIVARYISLICRYFEIIAEPSSTRRPVEKLRCGLVPSGFRVRRGRSVVHLRGTDGSDEWTVVGKRRAEECSIEEIGLTFTEIEQIRS